MNQTERMGTEKIPVLLRQLAVPAVVAQVINLLYNIVDRIYIGHMKESGAAALTGVGLFVPILMLITAFAMLVCSGGAPLMSMKLGKGDKKGAEAIIGNCFRASRKRNESFYNSAGICKNRNAEHCFVSGHKHRS